MMEISYTAKYKKDLKRVLKSGVSVSEIDTVIRTIASSSKLPDKYRDHALTDDKHFKNCRECHIRPNVLLVYRILNKNLVLELLRIASHGDLFSTSLNDRLVFV